MKIRSLKVIVEANDIRKVFDLKEKISFTIPSEKYEEMKTFIVYGDGEIGLIPEGGKFLIVDKMEKELTLNALAPQSA